MDASRDTMEKLIKNVTAMNQELYKTILEDAAVLESCGQNVPSLLRDVPELRMDVKFILVDLQTIIKACYATDRFYEKRYHLKNFYAGMLEGFKLLYGFGKMRNCTIWAKLGEHLQAVVGSEPLFGALKQQYDGITQSLLAIEASKTEQDDRNLTYHYDDDLLLVYRLTLKMDSEEKAGLKFIEYLKILGTILELANQIELLYATKGLLLPVGEARHDDIALMIVQQAAKSFGEHPKLPDVLLMAVDKGAEQLDSYARMKKSILSLQEYIGKTVKIKTTFPEIDVLKWMLDAQMMVTFMMADASSIMRGFLGAGSKVECPLTLRRLTISRVSTLNHLIGYKKDDTDSMWGRILTIIPEGYQSLRNEGLDIEKRLLAMRRKRDIDTRALYVHLIDNHKYRSNVPAIVKALENPKILLELKASQEVVIICGTISRFLSKLMDALSTVARKSRMESEMKLKKQIDDIRQLTYYPQCPDLLGANMRKQLDEVERIISSEL